MVFGKGIDLILSVAAAIIAIIFTLTTIKCNSLKVIIILLVLLICSGSYYYNLRYTNLNQETTETTSTNEQQPIAKTVTNSKQATEVTYPEEQQTKLESSFQETNSSSTTIKSNSLKLIIIFLVLLVCGGVYYYKLNQEATEDRVTNKQTTEVTYPEKQQTKLESSFQETSFSSQLNQKATETTFTNEQQIIEDAVTNKQTIEVTHLQKQQAESKPSFQETNSPSQLKEIVLKPEKSATVDNITISLIGITFEGTPLRHKVIARVSTPQNDVKLEKEEVGYWTEVYVGDQAYIVRVAETGTYDVKFLISKKEKQAELKPSFQEINFSSQLKEIVLKPEKSATVDNITISLIGITFEGTPLRHKVIARVSTPQNDVKLEKEEVGYWTEVYVGDQAYIIRVVQTDTYEVKFSISIKK